MNGKEWLAGWDRKTLVDQWGFHWIAEGGDWLRADKAMVEWLHSRGIPKGVQITLPIWRRFRSQVLGIKRREWEQTRRIREKFGDRAAPPALKIGTGKGYFEKWPDMARVEKLSPVAQTPKTNHKADLIICGIAVAIFIIAYLMGTYIGMNY